MQFYRQQQIFDLQAAEKVVQRGHKLSMLNELLSAYYKEMASL